MEQFNDMPGMLELILRPAFAVKDGIVQYSNCALVSAGTPIGTILETGASEYAELSSGCLYLTLRIDEHPFGASVTPVGGFDVFILDDMDVQPQLQAMALAARELREPLSNMLIAADKLLPLLAGQADSAAQQADLLNRSLYQMLRLIGNMSDAARYAAEIAPRKELTELRSFFHEIFEKAAQLAASAQITLRFTNLTESINALADTEKLERAVYNILSNAIKFTAPGGFVDIRLTTKGSKLYLTVSDSGCGIPGDILGSVYARYLRQPDVEDGRHGIGLGMVMIRSAASAHGGTVLIDHTGGSGTRLTMSMELQKESDGSFRSPRLSFDYAGEFDHALLELADVLPSHMYQTQ